MGGGMGGMGGGGGGFGGMGGGFGGMGGMSGEGDEKRSRKGGRDRGDEGESRSRRKKNKDDDDEEERSKDNDEALASKLSVAMPPVAALADFAQCDFAITPLQALRVILETASPGSVKSLYWHLDPTRVQINHDTIGLLEFMETELIFTEFARLLIRMSDLGTRKDIALCERLSPAARFEGFVRHVFLPALRTPYVSPVPAEEKSSDNASKDADDAPLASAREGAEAGDEAEAEEEQPEVKDEMIEPVELWHGFDDYLNAEVEAHHATRRWPSGYEKDIDEWV